MTSHCAFSKSCVQQDTDCHPWFQGSFLAFLCGTSSFRSFRDRTLALSSLTTPFLNQVKPEETLHLAGSSLYSETSWEWAEMLETATPSSLANPQLTMMPGSW